MHNRGMRYRFIALTLLAAVAWAADERLSVDQIVSFVSSAVKLKQPDKELADYLRHVRLTNRLDESTVENLQSLGAGPKTVAILRGLITSSAALPPPAPVEPKPPAPTIPPPDSIEQSKILDEVRQYALNYTKQLPNFICVQVTRRYQDPSLGGFWRLLDTITSRLSYFDQREDYKVVLVNSQPVNDLPLDKLGGTVSQGEFGSMMKEIFQPEAEARFGWDHWATLHGKRVMAFAYDIDQAHSKYHLIVDKTIEYVPAYRGLIYVNQDTHVIERLTQNPYDMPAGFPISEVKLVLDYDIQKIGDSEFMLPLKAVVSSRSPRFLTKNDVEFKLYRKFGTETTIKFEDVGDPMPEDKTKEKPPKP
jgi:hypothetical protein